MEHSDLMLIDCTQRLCIFAVNTVVFQEHLLFLEEYLGLMVCLWYK